MKNPHLTSYKTCYIEEETQQKYVRNLGLQWTSR